MNKSPSNRPPFRMEYRHLTKMRGTKKLLWNWNISLFQLLMDCLINNDMKSYKKPWNTFPQLWNLLISIFHSSMEFHGIPWNSPEVPWNSMELFHVKREVPWNSMELWKFHGTWCQHQIPWNSMELWCRQMTYHLVPWNSMEHSMEFHGTLEPPNDISLSSMEFHGTLTLTSYGILP